MDKKVPTVNRTPPVAPPVYRPQQTPKVLQTKSALIPRPQVIIPTKLQTRVAQPAKPQTFPKAPPVYRPQTKATPINGAAQRQMPNNPHPYVPHNR
ncbi:MAG TPA: hypothetical protein VJS17_10310, partial [Pyrinomonadaceae bacterium]|nr:hypothetical protein [Pyrinomonadaceae bacterium]